MNIFPHWHFQLLRILIFLKSTFLPRQEKARLLYFDINSLFERFSMSEEERELIISSVNSFIGLGVMLLCGQTFWHISQPNISPDFLSMASSLSVRSPFFWLMWEAHLSMQNFSPNAPPGQLSIHLLQPMQVLSRGMSASKSRSHRI